ncbi:MAG: helix-turn-helix transcriptional regulator, partial [Chloroflexota bacterium]
MQQEQGGRRELPLPRGTKGSILRLLRGGEATVDELAARLAISRNGVRFHLTGLERDGLVEQRPVRRGPRKPSHGYSLSRLGEALFPKRYDALLNAVLQDVRRGQEPREVEALFRRLGQRLAAEQAPHFAGLGPDERVAEALRFLGELGGAAEVEAERETGQHAIIGQSCPFGAVVARHPEVCTLLETFLAEVLPGATVCEACQKDGTPRCRFEVTTRPT